MSKATKRERQRQNRELARLERERMLKRDRRMKALRGFLIVLIPVIAVIVIIQLTRDDSDDADASGSNGGGVTCDFDRKPEGTTERNTAQTAPTLTIDPAKTYTASIETTCGTIDVTLDAATAPIATNNFVTLARQGFYDGTTWHRAAQDFVIQGGDPAGDGTGGPGYEVVGEVPSDNYPEGSLAAAKAGTAPAGSFGSQFFIVTGAQGATLPNEYARFGSVTDGLDVAKKLESFAPPEGDGAPTRDLYIFKVSITESDANAASSTTAPPASAPSPTP